MRRTPFVAADRLEVLERLDAEIVDVRILP
jgi:hypothetical protein